jgi:hypothetical protein
MPRDDEDTLDQDETQDLEGTGEESEEEELNEEEAEEVESDSEEEEQSDEDQDDLEEEDEEPVEEKGFKFKDAKTGNFDWQKINQRVGGPELEKSFKESQKTITRFAQEKKDVETRFQEVAPKAQLFDQFDHLVRTNPEVRAAIQKAMGGSPQNQQPDFTKIPGVNPDDPLLPVVTQLMQQNEQLNNRYQSWESQQQQQRNTEMFRQGLQGAKDRFTELVGREPSSDELRKVAEQMRQTRHLNGADWVPNLFIEQIREGTTQKYLQSRKAKKALPKTPKGGRPTATSGKKSFKGAFEEAWSELEDAE